jgi:bacterial leucyl aminopeptidase
MKFAKASLLAAYATGISARFVEINEADNVVLNPEETYLVETAPGKTKWVTEEEKWEMRRVCQHWHFPNSCLPIETVC